MKVLLAVVALSVAAAPLQAQRQLDRADSLLAAGEYAQARSLMLEWQRANPPSARVDLATRARAIYLNARLTEDAQQAQELYLTIALSYPTTPYAPDALLRLGQGLLAANENRRALAYLERLVTDYPSAANRHMGLLWLARAQSAAGNKAGACKTVSGALKSGELKGDIAAAMQSEEKNACASAEPEPEVKPETRPEPKPLPRTESTPPPAPATATARFALQAGAFRNAQSATAIASQLKRAGFDARVARIGESELSYVRVGRFSARAEAADEAARLRAAGFNVIIVDDVGREKQP